MPLTRQACGEGQWALGDGEGVQRRERCLLWGMLISTQALEGLNDKAVISCEKQSSLSVGLQALKRNDVCVAVLTSQS